MQPMTVLNYILIENAAEEEVKRLSSTPSFLETSNKKAQEITAAIDRLYLAVIQQHPEFLQEHPRNTGERKIDPLQVQKIDFTTTDSMLNANIREWESEIKPWIEQDLEFPGRQPGYRPQNSLSTALNVAQNNPLNIFLFSSWGPLWGKARALENVEEQLAPLSAEENSLSTPLCNALWLIENSWRYIIRI